MLIYFQLYKFCRLTFLLFLLENIRYYSIAPHWYWIISIVLRRGYELPQSDQYIISILQEYYIEESE